MSDDANNDEAGKEIARGIATTPDAAPSPAQLRKAQAEHDALFEHRLQQQANGGFDADEIADHKQFLKLDQTRTTPVNAVFYRKGDHPNAITLAEREQFLLNYMRCGVWNHAAYVVGRSGRSFRELAKTDPVFAIQVGEAVHDWREQLQGEVIRRGMYGTAEPIFAGKEGDLVGYKRVYSDTLLKMEIEASWPSRYRTTQTPQVDEVAMRNQGVMVVPGVANSVEEWKRDLRTGSAGSGNKTTRPVQRIGKGAAESK